jgi:hypothetical protein
MQENGLHYRVHYLEVTQGKNDMEAVRPVIDAKAQHPCHVPELVALDAHHLTLQINTQSR